MNSEKVFFCVGPTENVRDKKKLLKTIENALHKFVSSKDSNHLLTDNFISTKPFKNLLTTAKQKTIDQTLNRTVFQNGSLSIVDRL
jgi:hypothetical protein